MANKYYQPGTLRAAKVSALFSAIAPRYDLINDLQSFGLHRLWKRKLIGLARVEPGDMALDLCCGTGDIAFALARRGARTVGLDFNEPMLTVARRRLAVRHRPAAASPARLATDCVPGFLRGDALNVPFRSDSFDIVAVGYGLRNLASLEDGLREMHRLAKPGGRLLALDFGKPDNAFWRRLYFVYLGFVVPVFGRTCCGDAQSCAYIIESLRHYPPQRDIAGMMRELGCIQVGIVNLLGGMMSIQHGVKPVRAMP